jgi:WD40 repeat protein
MLCFEKMPLWVKGITVIERDGLIFTWSQLEATFHNTEGKLIFKYKALSAFEDYITDVIVKMESKVFITSTLSGQISVWKYQKEKELLHQFTGHTNKVTSMKSFPGRADLFISASNDNSIRVHSLDKL